MTSVEEIRKEHHDAINSLTKEQRRALGRLERAKNRSNFNHKTTKENLEIGFEVESRLSEDVYTYD